MDMTLLKEGLIIMLIGMGTVFAFLIIMVWVMGLNEKILKLVAKYFPEEVVETKTANKNKTTVNNDDEIALAIACAVHKAQKA